MLDEFAQVPPWSVMYPACPADVRPNRKSCDGKAQTRPEESQASLRLWHSQINAVLFTLSIKACSSPY